MSFAFVKLMSLLRIPTFDESAPAVPGALRVFRAVPTRVVRAASKKSEAGVAVPKLSTRRSSMSSFILAMATSSDVMGEAHPNARARGRRTIVHA